ncbi:hypothetical protein D3C80_1885250 [compost metagenome]
MSRRLAWHVTVDQSHPTGFGFEFVLLAALKSAFAVQSVKCFWPTVHFAPTFAFFVAAVFPPNF